MLQTLLKPLTRCFRAPSFLYSQLVRPETIHPRKYFSFSKQDLVKLSSTFALPFNDKILIYVTLKNQHSFLHSPLQNFIISRITSHNQALPLLGLFLQAYQLLNIECLKYYIDYYSNINASAIQQLTIAKYLSTIKTHKVKDPADKWMIETAKEKNKTNLTRLFVSSSLNFSEFIEFMRLFLNQTDPRLLEAYIETRYEQPRTVEEKILLAYMCSVAGIQFHRYQLPLGTENPKSICMLCELLKGSKPHLMQGILHQIKFERWDYDSIVWVSQYLNQSQLSKAHERLCQTSLTDINTLILYIQRTPPSLHQSLSQWLCKQLSSADILQQWKSEDLLEVLDYLPAEHKFKNYLLLLAKQCKGRLNWEETTKLYYYCRRWNVDSEDVDALRIYVVNGYTSMGTARTRIPTSSFYYKLIEIVSAKQLFRYKVPFS